MKFLAPVEVPTPTASGHAATKAYADAIHGVPAGGASGTFLGKNSGTDYDAGWLAAPVPRFVSSAKWGLD